MTDISTSLDLVSATKSKYKYKQASLTNPQNLAQLEFPWTGGNLVSKGISELSETNPFEITPTSAQGRTSNKPPHHKRIYPHLYSSNGVAVELVGILEQAAVEADATSHDYQDGNIEAVANRLPVLAVSFARAYPHTKFNPPLGACVSFLRRATLNADASEISFSALMILSKSIRVLVTTPLISLDAGTELIEKLEAEGWNGENEALQAFAKALLDGLKTDQTQVGQGVSKKVVAT